MSWAYDDRGWESALDRYLTTPPDDELIEDILDDDYEDEKIDRDFEEYVDSLMKEEWERNK